MGLGLVENPSDHVACLAGCQCREAQRLQQRPERQQLLESRTAREERHQGLLQPHIHGRRADEADQIVEGQIAGGEQLHELLVRRIREGKDHGDVVRSACQQLHEPVGQQLHFIVPGRADQDLGGHGRRRRAGAPHFRHRLPGRQGLGRFGRGGLNAQGFFPEFDPALVGTLSGEGRLRHEHQEVGRAARQARQHRELALILG